MTPVTCWIVSFTRLQVRVTVSFISHLKTHLYITLTKENATSSPGTVPFADDCWDGHSGSLQFPFPVTGINNRPVQAALFCRWLFALRKHRAPTISTTTTTTGSALNVQQRHQQRYAFYVHTLLTNRLRGRNEDYERLPQYQEQWTATLATMTVTTHQQEFLFLFISSLKQWRRRRHHHSTTRRQYGHDP